MTTQEIIKLYLADLNNIVPQSPARDNRIAMLESELAALESQPEVSDNRWNFTKEFENSEEYKRLITELKIERDRVIITVGKVYDYLIRTKRL